VKFSKKKIFFKNEYFEERVNKLCDFINNLSFDTVCLLSTCHMCDVLNIAMLNRNNININSKEILLIAEDTIDCIPYIKKRVTKI